MPEQLRDTPEREPPAEAVVIPVAVVLAKLARLRAAYPVLREFADKGFGDAHKAAAAEIHLLEELIVEARRSADDLLNQEESEAWSGLKTDSLRKNYPSVGRGSERRWRRGVLPVNKPFGHDTVDHKTGSGSLDSVEVAINTEDLDLDAVALEEEDILARALEKSLAA